ncbi:MAG: MFS transporter, partial [Desulfobacterales bacterium]
MPTPVPHPANSAKPPPLRLAYTIWSLGAIFYLIGFYHRVAPAVITAELMRGFQINAAALGNLSAFYYYSYVAMQIPTGVLADRWGPRRLLTLGCLVASAGTLLFAWADQVLWAALGRLLIGGSVAVAFISILKLAGHWFAPARFAMLTGLALLAGVLGAVGAGVPLRQLTEWFGWRPVMAASALFTFLIGTVIWWRVRDDPRELGYRSYIPQSDTAAAASFKEILTGFKEIIRYRNTWLLFVVPGGIVGCVLTFTGLWGVPFLTRHYHLSVTQASTLTSTALVAWA